jgi:16S rRNA (guanine1207-N2)-methyltransferase
MNHNTFAFIALSWSFPGLNHLPTGTVPGGSKEPGMRSGSSDPAIVRAQELVEKHFPTLESVLWLNPPSCLGAPRRAGWRLWQPHYPDSIRLRQLGWPDQMSQGTWDAIVVYASKHKDENWALLDAADSLLSQSGYILFAVPNEYGAKSYQQELAAQGRMVHYESGRKSRLYRLQGVGRPARSPDQLCRNSSGFWSCPGLFSWKAPDRGSLLLAETLKGENLAGPVGDFGAGWGYLGVGLDPALSLHLFESDRRGLEAARLNLPGRDLSTYWCDLTQSGQWPEQAPTRLGTVITNPPFHSGKREETELGRQFAVQAHRVLRPGQALWLVGNTHLAYPRLLSTLFASIEVRAQRDGYTVVRAVK